MCMCKRQPSTALQGIPSTKAQGKKVRFIE